MRWKWVMKCATEINAITLASRPLLAARGPTRTGCAIGSLVDDIDAQSPDAGDFYVDLVAALHPERRLAAQTDSVGRAGGDDVARLQPGHGREIFDDGGDVEDHVIGRVVLHHAAVQPRRELEPLGIGEHARRR